MKRVLITGSAGYLGGALTDYLSKKEYYVKGYDNLLFERQYLKDVPFESGDIRDRHKLLQLIEGENFDTIVWLAAMVGDPLCAHKPDLAKEINEDSLKWLSKVAGDKHIVFTSTCSTYGSNQKLNLTEEDETNPLSVYAETKLNAERYLKDCNSTILRLGTLYGLGDRFARPRFDLVVNVMTANMVQNKELTVFGGDQNRPIVHVKDIARVIEEAISRSITGTYNVTRYNMKIDRLANIIRDTLGYGDIKYEKREHDGLDERDYSVSTEKFKSVFNTKLMYPVERAIAEIAYAITKGRIKNFRDKTFNNILNFQERGASHE